MSMMGEMNFFFGVQVKQTKEGILINQSKYVKELINKFRVQHMKTVKIPMNTNWKSDPKEAHMDAAKQILRYLKGTPNVGLWYPADDNFKLSGYLDSDFAGCKIERKSTPGTCQFLVQQLKDYRIKEREVPIYCDSSSAIAISQNSVHHTDRDRKDVIRTAKAQAMHVMIIASTNTDT
ncbi:uncharacterized mitochondrial protein AtMg00810-like [Salvia miltiorrhiza]|uniref:uncharacterized mitochondrial protein AtMg00810-like n=1 Tax=Salvia miltiorrhiza TaxID=226208 RepID=UPI0025AD21C6|nr:uncharacterized mitochondrial protein AtMg00810-like [Salvia miltiorrhiza]